MGSLANVPVTIGAESVGRFVSRAAADGGDGWPEAGGIWRSGCNGWGSAMTVWPTIVRYSLRNLRANFCIGEQSYRAEPTAYQYRANPAEKTCWTNTAECHPVI